MAQQLLALQQYQAAEQYNSGTGLPSYPTVSNAYRDFNLNARTYSYISFQFGWPNANWNPNQPNPYSEN